jgi:hypothetical protein
MITTYITPEDIEASIDREYYFTGRQGVDGYDIEVLRASEPTAPLMLAAFSDDPDLKKTDLAPLESLTICILVLRNGTKIVGVNYGAIDPARHCAKTGRREARANAVEQIWTLLGYELRSKLASQQQAQEVATEEIKRQGLPPHQQRMLTERDELILRLLGLDRFIRGELFISLSAAEQSDMRAQERAMRAQERAMRAYLDHLRSRIARFELEVQT